MNMVSYVAVFFFFLVANPFAFVQASLETPFSAILGGDVDGEALHDNFGSAVAMSSNGNRMVIGAQSHDRLKGHARAYEYGSDANPTGWTQLGGDIDGEAQTDMYGNDVGSGEGFGSAVTMSADGNRMVIGAPNRNIIVDGTHDNGNSYTTTVYRVGRVRAYEYGSDANPTGWTQLGGDMDGEVQTVMYGYSQGEGFGSTVAISADGNRMVIGAPNYNIIVNITDYNGNSYTTTVSVGRVRAYAYGSDANPTGWTQLGGDMDGEAQTDMYGYSQGVRFGSTVAISADGNRIVIGTGQYISEGYARAYEYGAAASPSGWMQIGGDISSEAQHDQFGSAVTMSADGNRIVIGTGGDPYYYGGMHLTAGFVRVLQYGTAANPSDWSQIGADINGEAQNDQFGSAVALSGDGNRAAVGAPSNEAGHVRVFVTGCVEDAYVSASACNACAPGSTNTAGDALTQIDTVCDITYCAAYERIANHTCIPCPPGTMNAPGDDPTGDDTHCEPLICGENYRVFSHGCLACETSVFNRAGDDASGDDTECDGSEAYSSSTTVKDGCAAYGHVVNHTCVLCPPGSMNAPGDDPTGDDTDCDPLICGENYRVFSHECLACETDVLNRAGDDASDNDTECDGSEAYSPGSSTRLFRADYDDSSARSFDVGAVVWFTAGTMCVMSLFP